MSDVEGPAPPNSSRSEQDDDDKESDMSDLDGKKQPSDPLPKPHTGSRSLASLRKKDFALARFKT